MTNDKDSVASYIGSGTKGPFYCNHCNRKLDCLDQDTREYPLHLLQYILLP
jgi:hypothetical protein